MFDFLTFKTKTDINGNTYYLLVNNNNKTFSRTPARINPDGIIVTRRTLREYVADLVSEGYTETSIM